MDGRWHVFIIFNMYIATFEEKTRGDGEEASARKGIKYKYAFVNIKNIK